MENYKIKFMLLNNEGLALGLDGERKKYVTTLLTKLMPIADKINKIVIIEDKEGRGIRIELNNVELQIDDWKSVDIPVDNELYKLLEKLFTLDFGVDIKIYKEKLWALKVYRAFSQYVDKVFNILEIKNTYDIKKISPLFDATEQYYAFEIPGDDYLYIVSRQNLKKFLELNGISSEIVEDSFEITVDDKKYKIMKGENDGIHISVIENDKLLTSLKTYLWYFGVKSFDELKNLDTSEIVGVINRQKSEKYFYPMPYNEVKNKVQILVNNLLDSIDEAIDSVVSKELTFTKLIKNIVSIACIFDRNCGVGLELDELGGLSVYYSLLSTDEGHLPIPIFLEYLGYDENDCFDEADIGLIKNIIYFIKGYNIYIPEDEREHYLPDEDDGVREAKSLLFQKAVVLYNKLLKESGEENDEDIDCPWGTLYDGFGYCRKIDNEELLTKSEDELINEILKSLVEIREKIVSYKMRSE